MKKIVIFAAYFGMLFMASALEENLLNNPSFELPADNNPELPAFWRGGMAPKASLGVFYKYEKQFGKTGNCSVVLTNEIPAAQKAMVWWIQHNLHNKLNKIPIGQDMELSVYAKAKDKPVKCRIYLESLKLASYVSPFTTIKPDKWTKLTFHFKNKKNDYPSAYVILQMKGSGTVFLDDAYLGIPKNPVPAKAKGELIDNGSIDCDNPAGWRPSKIPTGCMASAEIIDPETGNYALKLSSPNDTPKGMLFYRQYFQKNLKNLKHGAQLELSFRAFTENNKDVKFSAWVEFRKNNKFIGHAAILKDLSTTSAWNTFTLPFTLPNEIPDIAYVVLRLNTKGTVWFDDISIVPIEE